MIRLLSENIGHPVSAKFCIIGAGFAGILAARRLARSGQKVVLLESGLSEADADTQSLDDLEDQSGRYKGPPDGRLRGLGGASRQWGGRLLPLTPGDIGERAYIGLPGWPVPYEELDQYRNEIELMFGLDDTSYEEDATAGLGLAALIPWGDRYIAPRYPKWINFRACNLAYLFEKELRASESIEVWLGATVTTFVLDKETCVVKSVVAQSLAGHRLEVQSANFILSSGTIETTRLLLTLNRQSGDKVFDGCFALGRYFQDHLGCAVGKLVTHNAYTTNRWFGYHLYNNGRRSVHLETTAKAQAEDRAASGFAHVSMEIPEDSSMQVLKNLVRGLQSGKFNLSPSGILRLALDAGGMARTLWWRYRWNQLFVPADISQVLHIWAEQVPHADSRIILSNEADRLGAPKARLDWRITEDDEHTIRTIVERTRVYWSKSGLDAACPIEWAPEVAKTGAKITDLLGGVYHPSGTTRMGTDPTESVVDSQLCCHYIRNVTVCSASVFPAPGSANPTMALMQLTLRAADHLAANAR